MKETFDHDEEMSKSFIEEYMDSEEDFLNDQEIENNLINKSCLSKFCYYIWC